MKFLQNLFFDFHEIQHLSSKRPIFLCPKAQPLAQTYLISASNLVIFWCFFKVKGHKWKKFYYVKSLTIQIYGNLNKLMTNGLTLVLVKLLSWLKNTMNSILQDLPRMTVNLKHRKVCCYWLCWYQNSTEMEEKSKCLYVCPVSARGKDLRQTQRMETEWRMVEHGLAANCYTSPILLTSCWCEKGIFLAFVDDD